MTEYSVRIYESHDWVIFVLLGSMFAFLFMMLFLHRDGTIRDFLLQKYFESGNVLMSWIIVSVVFSLLSATLFANHLPMVPKVIADIQLFGWQLNNFGFLLWTIFAFYLVKSLLGFLFYNSIGNGRKWTIFYFTSTRFYFVFSLVLMILVFINYYTSIDKAITFQIFLLTYAIAFVFKNLFYLFHKNNIMPKFWYYKFLYICTLQIAPLIALWRWLFL